MGGLLLPRLYENAAAAFYFHVPAVLVLASLSCSCGGAGISEGYVRWWARQPRVVLASPELP